MTKGAQRGGPALAVRKTAPAIARGKARPAAIARARGVRRAGRLRRPGRAASKQPSRRNWLLALLVLALLFWLWPQRPAPEAPKAMAQAALPHATGPAAARDPPAPKDPKPAAAARSKLAAAAPKARAPRPEGISREAVLAAVQARSPVLRACPLPPGAPARVSARLRIARQGELRTVQFVNAEPLPRPLAECLRTAMQRWNFKELALQSDVQVLVDFLLGG